MPEVLIKSTDVTFKKGETIFKEGDIGEEMYIIMSGEVEVVKKIQDEEIVLATLRENSFFGEMALFGDRHRSATVRAVTDTVIKTINKSILDMQIRKAPDWFVAIMRTLVIRLKETNKRLKSRFHISLEYSLLKMFYWVMNAEGEAEGSTLKAELGPILRKVRLILGISKDEAMVKLKDFSFIQMIKFSEEKNEIFIPDVEKLTSFLLFLQGKKDRKTQLTSEFEKMQHDSEKMQYFERIYRLLVRRKGEPSHA